MKIADLKVVVTGGASGLGLAFTRHLVNLNAYVWIIDRDHAALESLGQEFSNSTARCRWVYCDIGDESQVIRNVQAVWEESGGIEVLVNNAAVLKDQALVSRLGRNIKKHSLADWEETMRSNLTGAFLMAREVGEAMIRAKRCGLIVNISSISRHGNPGQSAYAASKAAIDALTSTWSQELAFYGIRVVAIAPGFVQTAMTKKIPPLFLERIKERTPLKRFGRLEEFEHTLQYVIENDYLNGKVLELDGGLRF